MIQPKTAQNFILNRATFRRIRQIALELTSNRVLSQDVKAACDSPDFDKAVMDGFAVRSWDIKSPPVIFRVVENITAGRPPRKGLKRGECAKIATGAMMPNGADAVVIKEQTRGLSPSKVKILKKVRRRENVYSKAMDFKKGELLLKKGSPLTPARVALLSSQGFKTVKVFDAPTVAILCTGNEVIEPGMKKESSRIWNASGSMLSCALRSMNIQPTYLGIARDETRALQAKIRLGLKYDILIITGAVSVGDLDLVPHVLKRNGVTPVFHKVSIRPGKPLFFGIGGHGLIFGLPGNPVSSMMGFLLFIKPAIKKMLGQNPGLPIEGGILSKGVYNKSGRMSFLPAVLKPVGRGYVIDPLRYSGSADLSSVSAADAFFILGPRQTFVPRHSRVNFLRATG